MKLKRTATATASCLLAFGGVLTVGIGPASAAAVCGPNKPVTIPGGKSSYSVGCGATVTHVSGWLEDTSADGKCVQIKIWWPGNQVYTYTPKACPSGTRVYFDHNGISNPTPPTVLTYTIG
ncbi:hypothetical protein ACFYST_22755 [Kitasatospora sp. NPDC004614]|uniref:hypothetical protein n=1 Tax=unclassified Kitasatospora TaxID=2633591 RepID=UPI0036911A3C